MGVKQWVFQRLSNVAIVIAGLWLLYFLISPGAITYETLANLFADQTTVIYFTVTLLLAGLNSILAGWQIIGDYAGKFGLNHNFLVGFVSIVSLAYIGVGLCLLLF